MAFCSGGLAAIRKIWNNISPELETIVEDVTAITGKIKALETNPTVEAIVAIIPAGSVIEAGLNKAIDLITGAIAVEQNVAQKITDWLNGKTTLQANADLLKLASTTVAQLDPAPDPNKTESTYDSIVQLRVIVDKH